MADQPAASSCFATGLPTHALLRVHRLLPQSRPQPRAAFNCSLTTFRHISGPFCRTFFFFFRALQLPRLRNISLISSLSFSFPTKGLLQFLARETPVLASAQATVAACAGRPGLGVHHGSEPPQHQPQAASAAGTSSSSPPPWALLSRFAQTYASAAKNGCRENSLNSSKN